MTYDPYNWLHHSSKHGGHTIHSIQYCTEEGLKHWSGLPYDRFKQHQHTPRDKRPRFNETKLV